ncbi:MAG: ankyrin repeat domain-containing protein [Gammaproteobacteria bacterium]|nr:ankyrin repeat domain-containing protein [Gammaproteobacteria bacterium]
MKAWKRAAIGVLSLAAMAMTTTAMAQESLVDLVRAGKREAVLAAITSPDLDVNTPAPDGATALHWATYQVDHELVRALLKAGAKANVTNRFGSTPLTEAVKLGDVELVRMLLDAGADADSPNQDNQTALMLAANLGALDIARMLLDKGANVNAVEQFRGQTALMWAAAENHPEIVALLLANGAEVSIRAKHDDWPRQMTSEPRAQFRPTGGLTPLLYATRSGCYRCVVAMVEAGADVNQPNPDGVTPLLNALDSKSFDIAMYLLDKGAKPGVWDMNGRTPLYLAVDMNSFEPRGFFGFGGTPAMRRKIDVTAMEVVNRLIKMGVDVNHQLTRMRPNGPGRGRFADYMMRGGTSALMVATLSYDTVAIKTLLENGAEVDLPNVFQITPLMAATGMSGNGRGPGGPMPPDIQEKVIEVVDLLLAHGANINAQVTDSRTHTGQMDAYIQGVDLEGWTALFSAAEIGWFRVVQHLIERGADPAIRNANGLTALDAAKAPPRSGPSVRLDEVGREATVAYLSKLLGEPVPAATTKAAQNP